MDLTLYTIIRGLAIGILVSAPMGPIGILCIQRTLNKGRWSGFVTGLGAALSDLIYALLTGLGMSIVIDFIEANQNILQILGSLVLVGFGLYLYRQNPAKNIRKANSSINTFTQDFIFAPVKQKLTSIVRQKQHKKKANPYFLEDAYAQPIFDS